MGTPYGIASPPRFWSFPLGWLFSVSVAFAYYAVLEATLGATIGKLAMGIRVVKLDGSPISWQEAIIRNLVRSVDALFVYLVAAIAVWNSPLRQRLGDMAANTIVIRVRPAPLPGATRFPGPGGQPGMRQ